MITKGHNSVGYNSVVNLQTLTCKNLNLGLVKVNAYAKFDQIPSISPQDTERSFQEHKGPT